MIETTANANAHEIKDMTRKGRPFSALLAQWPLLLILTLQALVTFVTLHNTVFQDEGLYLYAGRQILHLWMGGPPLGDPYAYYFSGYPYFYPVIGGILDRIGGLTLARSFSLLCMMGVTTCVYFITNKLFNRNAAIFASALYVSLASVLFIGFLATYDALCLVLLATATAIAYHVSTSHNPWSAVWVGPLLLLAVVAKYAALLFVLPVLVILIFVGLANLGWLRTLVRLAIVVVSTSIVGMLAYRFMDKDALVGLSLTTTNRTALIQKTPLELLMRVLQLGGIAYALAILGVVLLFINKRYRWLAVLLFGLSWLVPVYHIYKQELASIDKHMAFSLFFVMPVVGFALSWLSEHGQLSIRHFLKRITIRGYWLSGLAIVLLAFTFGTQQAQSIYTSWGNSSGLNNALHKQLWTSSSHYLAEDIEITRYYGRDVSDPWQWTGVNSFNYVKSTKEQYSGDEAYTQAIHDRYFDIVELSFNYQPGQAHFVAQQMAQSKNYDLITKVRTCVSSCVGYYYVWHKAAVAGQGNFTNLTQIELS